MEYSRKSVGVAGALTTTRNLNSERGNEYTSVFSSRGDADFASISLLVSFDAQRTISHYGKRKKEGI